MRRAFALAATEAVLMTPLLGCTGDAQPNPDPTYSPTPAVENCIGPPQVEIGNKGGKIGQFARNVGECAFTASGVYTGLTYEVQPNQTFYVVCVNERDLATVAVGGIGEDAFVPIPRGTLDEAGVRDC